MRDDRNINGPMKTVLTQTPRNTGRPSVNTSLPQRKFYRSRRSDSTPTEPSIDGRFFESTNYEAVFASVRPTAGSASWIRRNSVQPNNPLFFTDCKFEWEGISDDSLWRYGLNTTLLTPNVPASVISRARNSCLEKIRNTDLNFAVSAGEIRESVGTITSLLGDAVKLLRSIRHPIRSLSGVSVGSAKEIGTAASREYLRYMYGIRPIMSDIYGVSEGIQNGFVDLPLCEAVAKVRDESFSPEAWSGNKSPKVWLTGKAVRGCKVAVVFGVSNPTRYQLWRYGLTNPLALAWELTTLSFVIDWFTGIGNFLAGLQAPMGLVYKWGYETLYLENDLVLQEAIYENRFKTYLTIPVLEGVASTYYRTRAMKRTAGVGFPVPLPFFELKLNLSRALSLIALLTTRLG